MDLIEWITNNIQLTQVDTGDMYYGGESQSGCSLPVIYIPFDPNDPGHWADRGSALDFSISVGEGRILDFGPGDGWPSLVIAPFVQEVVGVEGTEKRVQVCADNAQRIGATNTSFVYVKPGQKLPFDDGWFDGIVAASSVEETPEPQEILAELFRCLRPGGVLRMCHEAYVEHIGSPALEVIGPHTYDSVTCLDIWDRHLDLELVRHISFSFDLPVKDVEEIFCGQPSGSLSIDAMALLAPHIIDSFSCIRKRPSGSTLAKWLQEIGFSSVESTYNGSWFARELFSHIPLADRPKDMAGVDKLLRPLIEVAITIRKPIGLDGTITAVK